MIIGKPDIKQVMRKIPQKDQIVEKRLSTMCTAQNTSYLFHNYFFIILVEPV
jgi:hypothetical protein